MGTTRYGTRLSIKKSQLDSIGGGGSSEDARTVYTKSFKITHTALGTKGAVTTASFTPYTLGPNEGVRWVWYQTTTAWVGATLFASLSYTGGTNDSMLKVQENISAQGNYDDNGDFSNTDNVGDRLGAHKAMGESGAGYDATTLMAMEKELKIYTTTTGGTNHNDASAGVSWIHVEIVRYDPDQSITVS